MSYTIDTDLKEGMQLLEEGKKTTTAFKLINKSAISGTTKGKSFFEIARIMREGAGGMKANPEESRRYYDAAMEHFLEEPCDSMDHREMGDYYYYGLGTKEANLTRALEYYDLASSEGDELAKEKASEIRGIQRTGSGVAQPVLTPAIQLKEEPVAPVSYAQPEVEKAPVVTSEAKEAEEDPLLSEVIDSEQMTLKALRLLDSLSSNKQDKLDGVEMAKAAAENGSCRASVLVGYLYEGDNSIVAKDYDLAKKYYQQAIDLGSASALFRLGILYTDKEASFYNLNKGHEMIIEAAHRGYSWALQYIGDCFRVKVVDSRNLDLAYRYYAMSGERGLGIGYHNMAEIDASRQQLGLAQEHERMAKENGYDPALGYQDPLFYTLHI